MQQIRLLAGTTDVDSIRSETFRGRSFTVVPVVALVEGVIQGLNATEPEYAPADEFAKFPAGWNGRPITMNHPRSDGELCSANSPDVLEEFAFGFLANSTRDDTKLKTEAWIDDEIVEEKAGDFQATVDRLKAGEMVEVSTGLFTEVVPTSGIQGDVIYTQAWKGVVPDHLAFLPEGTIGACSVADGCGAPRLNQGALITANGSRVVVIGGDAEHCCNSCAQGGSCMAENAEGAGENAEAPAPAANEGENAEGTGDQGQQQEQSDAEESPETATEQLQANAFAACVLDRLALNAVPSGMTFDNIRQIVAEALREAYENACYISAMTSDMVAFEQRHDSGCGCGCCYSYYDARYVTMGVSYTLSEDGGVTFTGEPVPVNLIVTIVPKPGNVTADSNIAANEGNSGANQQDQEGQMAEESQNEDQNGGAGGDVNANANGAGNEQAPRDLASFLAAAPPEIAAVLQEGVELRTQQRTTLIERIVANSNGVYSAEDLAGKDIPELKKLDTLSAPQPADFRGRSFPSGHTEGISGNSDSRANQRSVPPPPKAFERRTETGQDNNGGRESNAA
jgi:hypothetical protein